MGIYLVFVGIAAVAGVVSYYLGQQRIRAIAAFAGAHGLTVQGRQWDHGDCGFSLFDMGNRRSWRNVLRGAWNGLPVTYCDYTYVTGSGKNQNTVSFSNVIGQLGMQMPWVTVAPRSVIGALAERSVGAPGIRFESIEFNDRFDVQSGDSSFAVELIDARMIETLLGLDHGYHVVFGPEYLMVYVHRRSVDEIGAIFDAAARVVQRIPDLVRERCGPQPAALGQPPPPAA
jgi:hypothetical protein